MDNPFDVIACEYDKWFEREGKLLYLSELIAYHTILLPPNNWKRILEVGVGTGRFSIFEKLIGVDPSFSMLKIAVKRGVLPLKAFCEELPLKKESFDLITIITSLCFIKNKSLCLKECRRVIRKKGTLILGFINRESEWGRLYIKKAQNGHPIYSHAEFLSMKDVKRLLKGLFEIDKIVSTLFYPEYKIFTPEVGFVKEAGFVLVRASAI